MLYRPKPDPLSLPALIAWLEQQPAGTPYDWAKCSLCLVANYLHSALGVPRQNCINYANYAAICGGSYAYYQIAGQTPHTYGAALERAYAMETTS